MLDFEQELETLKTKMDRDDRDDLMISILEQAITDYKDYRRDLDSKFEDNIKIKRMEYENATLEMLVAGPLTEFVSMFFHELFVKSDATNFCGWMMTARHEDIPYSFRVTLQKEHMETPEEQCSRLRKELADAQQELRILKGTANA